MLQEQLSTLKAQSSRRISPDIRRIMEAETSRLRASALLATAPRAGDKLPPFSLTNQHGATTHLEDLLAQGPAVITFYRGGWCPYCNLELRAYQHLLPEIRLLGATLVAITPELPDSSLTTTQKNELEFEVLTDLHSEYGREIGIVFTLSEELRTIYSNFGLDLEKHNGAGQYSLPCPATFVIDTDGTIVYAFIDADYTIRAEPERVLQALKTLAR